MFCCSNQQRYFHSFLYQDSELRLKTFLNYWWHPGDNISAPCAAHVSLLLQSHHSSLGLYQGPPLILPLHIFSLSSSLSSSPSSFPSFLSFSFSSSLFLFLLPPLFLVLFLLLFPFLFLLLQTINFFLRISLQSMSVLTHTSAGRGRAYYMDTRFNLKICDFLKITFLSLGGADNLTFTNMTVPPSKVG